MSGDDRGQADQATFPRLCHPDPRRTHSLPDGTSELDVIAAEAKIGTEHATHGGWTWAYPDRVLRCGCGAVLAPGREATS